MTYKQAASELKSYVEFTDYKKTEFRAKRGAAGFAEPPAFVVREATQSEVGRIKGEALDLGGHSAEARVQLMAPARRGEQEDARLLAAIGLHERRNQNDERARKYLEAAVRASAPRPRAYVELARLRLAEIAMKKHRESDEPGLNSEQTAFVLEPLRSAHRQRLVHVEIYEQMAEAWTVSTVTPVKEDLIPLFQASIAYPGRLRLIYLTASLAARSGILREANALIEHGVKWAPDETARKRFEELRVWLPATTAPAAAVPSAAAKVEAALR